MVITHYAGRGYDRTFLCAKPQVDKSIFRECDTLTPGMREEIDAFYAGIDEDLAGDRGEVL